MTKKCTFITQFNRNLDSIRNTGVVEFTAPSKVKESLTYATDINTIYQNYCKTGHLPLNGQRPIYDENFINYDSLIEAQKGVQEATLYFNSLPSEIRSQYGNKLENFVNAIHSQDDFLVQKGVLKLKDKSIKQDLNIKDVVVNTPVKESVVAPVETPATTV